MGCCWSCYFQANRGSKVYPQWTVDSTLLRNGNSKFDHVTLLSVPSWQQEGLNTAIAHHLSTPQEKPGEATSAGMGVQKRITYTRQANLKKTDHF